MRTRKLYCKWGHERIPENVRGFQCKICCRKYSWKYQEEKAEILRKRVRNSELKKGFGITIDDYDKILEKQDFKCAICRIPQSSLEKRLAVDHCHKTGKVRGLLCLSCNTVIVPTIEKFSHLIAFTKGYLNEEKESMVA